MIGYASYAEPPEGYPDETPCDRCEHPLVDHGPRSRRCWVIDPEICHCPEWKPPYINPDDLPEREN